jgi:hypothetical protein
MCNQKVRLFAGIEKRNDRTNGSCTDIEADGSLGEQHEVLLVSSRPWFFTENGPEYYLVEMQVEYALLHIDWDDGVWPLEDILSPEAYKKAMVSTTRFEELFTYEEFIAMLETEVLYGAYLKEPAGVVSISKARYNDPSVEIEVPGQGWEPHPGF